MLFTRFLIIFTIFGSFLFAGLTVSPTSNYEGQVFTFEYTSTASLDDSDPKLKIYRNGAVIELGLSMIRQNSTYYAKAYIPPSIDNYKARVVLSYNGNTYYSDFVYFDVLTQPSNQAPTVSNVSGSVSSIGDLTVSFNPYDPESSTRGADVYLSYANNPNSFNPNSKKTISPSNFTGTSTKSLTYSKAELESFGITNGKTYNIRVNLYDAQSAEGVGYSSTYTYIEILIPLNGQCGTANNHTFLATDTGYGSFTQCSQGVSDNTVFPSQGASVSWNCGGSNGGSSVTCNASRGSDVVQNTNPTTIMTTTLPACKSTEHRNRGYACIKVGTSLDLTFSSNDSDGDLKSLEVDIDGSGGTPEYTKNLYGSSDTITIPNHNFNKDMFSLSKCNKYKNKCLSQMFTLTATAYDSRYTFTKVGTTDKYLLYDLSVHNQQQEDIKIAQEEEKRRQIEAEKANALKLKEQKEVEKLNTINTKNNTILNYTNELERNLLTYGDIPDGFIGNDCGWRELGVCKYPYIDAHSRNYGFKLRDDDYRKYPYSLYVQYDFNKKYKLEYNDEGEVINYFPATLWIEYHMPSTFIDLFNHDVDKPNSKSKYIVNNSKQLEVQSSLLIEQVKYEIDVARGDSAELYFNAREKYYSVGEHISISKDSLLKYKQDLEEAFQQTKEELELSDEEWKFVASLTIDSIPVLGTIKSIGQVATGDDLITGEEIARFEEAGMVIVSIVPAGKLAAKGFKNADKIADLTKKSKQAIKRLRNNFAVGKKFEKLQAEKLKNIYPNLISKGKNKSVCPKCSRTRIIDLYYKETGLAIECKVGKLGLNKRIREELNNDFELLMNGKESRVIEVRWMLAISPSTGKGGLANLSKPLKNYVAELNIKLVKNAKKPILFSDSTVSSLNLLN